MNFIKRIFSAGERLRRKNSKLEKQVGELESRIRELETEIEIRDNRLAIKEDQIELLIGVNGLNHRHLEDVLGSDLSSQHSNGFTSSPTQDGTPPRY